MSFACDLCALSFTDAGLTWDLSFVSRRGDSSSSERDSLLLHAQGWIAAHRDCLFE